MHPVPTIFVAQHRSCCACTCNRSAFLQASHLISNERTSHSGLVGHEFALKEGRTAACSSNKWHSSRRTIRCATISPCCIANSLHAYRCTFFAENLGCAAANRACAELRHLRYAHQTPASISKTPLRSCAMRHKRAQSQKARHQGAQHSNDDSLAPLCNSRGGHAPLCNRRCKHLRHSPAAFIPSEASHCERRRCGLTH